MQGSPALSRRVPRPRNKSHRQVEVVILERNRAQELAQRPCKKRRMKTRLCRAVGCWGRVGGGMHFKAGRRRRGRSCSRSHKLQDGNAGLSLVSLLPVPPCPCSQPACFPSSPRGRETPERPNHRRRPLDGSLANASARLHLGFYYLHMEDAVASSTSGRSATMTALLHDFLESAGTELCYKGE